MKLIELHILQSFPVSCLNRDEAGSPKTATFGGVNRARLSSQCLKRAARLHARDEYDTGLFAGERSRLLLGRFRDALAKEGLSDAEAEKKAKEIAEVFSKLETGKTSDVTTAVYLSPGEIAGIAQAISAGKSAKDAVKKAERLDAADIALFGRMVANDSTLNVEGAAMFSHALTTHRADNEIDFFSAVDDVKQAGGAEDAGAGMIGTLEYTSGCYYRYCAVNVDLFRKNTAGLTAEQQRAALTAFLHGVVLAIPGARRNSMNAATRPSYVLGLYREKGSPVQLVNAFEKPVDLREHNRVMARKAREEKPDEIYREAGLSEASVFELNEELKRLKEDWSIKFDQELTLPGTPLPELVSALTAGVA